MTVNDEIPTFPTDQDVYICRYRYSAKTSIAYKLNSIDVFNFVIYLFILLKIT